MISLMMSYPILNRVTSAIAVSPHSKVIQRALIVMTLEYLVQEPVREMLFALKWSDKFERDLKKRLKNLEEGMQDAFEEIKTKLIDLELANEYRGGAGSPYLALTDRGQAIADRLYEIQFILEHPDERSLPES